MRGGRFEYQTYVKLDKEWKSKSYKGKENGICSRSYQTRMVNCNTVWLLFFYLFIGHYNILTSVIKKKLR